MGNLSSPTLSQMEDLSFLALEVKDLKSDLARAITRLEAAVRETKEDQEASRMM